MLSPCICFLKALSYLFSNSKPSNNNKWHHKLIVLLNLRLSSRAISEIVFARSLGGKSFNDAPQFFFLVKSRIFKPKERSIRLKISEIADNTMQCQYVTWFLGRWIDHFGAPLSLSFKASLSAKFLFAWSLVLISSWMKPDFHNKDSARRLALKKRLRETQKWSIGNDDSALMKKRQSSASRCANKKSCHWSKLSLP